jgi:hypothetical protein
MDESRDSTSLESMLTDSSGSGDGDNRPWSILQCDVNGTLDSELYYQYLDRMADEDASEFDLMMDEWEADLEGDAIHATNVRTPRSVRRKMIFVCD